MSAAKIEKARRDVEWARKRMEQTLGALQQRLQPKTLVNDAWEGVRDKSTDLADDALQVVKERPAIASAAVGAVALFLARAPLRRAVSRLFSRNEDDGRVTTRIADEETNFDLTAPAAVKTTSQGAKA